MEISIRSIERFSKLTDVQLHQPRRGASHLFDPIWSKLRKPVLSWTKPSTVRYHPARDLPSAQLNSGGLTVQHAWRTSPFLWPESGIRWDKSCASFLSCNHGDD